MFRNPFALIGRFFLMGALMLGAALGGGGLLPRALASGTPATAAPQPPDERAEPQAPLNVSQASDGAAETGLAIGPDGVLLRPTANAAFERPEAQGYRLSAAFASEEGQPVKTSTPDMPAAPLCNPGSKAACVVVSSIPVNTTWYSNTIYVVYSSVADVDGEFAVTVDTGTTLTIEGGTIVKLYVAGSRPADPAARQSLVIKGNLILAGSAGNEVVFTSYNDDAYGGDTNSDGDCTLNQCVAQPAPGDFRDVRLKNSSIAFHHAIVRYGYYGVRVHSTTSAVLNPSIDFVTFSYNYFGLMLHVGSGSGSTGDITSSISNCSFSYNLYGLGTRSVSSTSASRPTITNNTFANHDETVWADATLRRYPNLPIYLDGTAYPTFSGNTFNANNKHLAIGLGGSFKATGTLSTVSGTPGLAGNLPYLILGDLLGDPNSSRTDGAFADFWLGSGVTLTVPAGTVFKFLVTGSDAILRYWDVDGNLDMQSTQNTDPNRVVFTSYKDDGYGGNTDAAISTPLAGQHEGITLYNNATTFDYALAQYAEKGVRVVNRFDNTANIAPAVLSDTLRYNITGALFLVMGSYDVNSIVLGNTFYTNTYGVMVRNNLSSFPTLYGGMANLTITNNQFNNHSEFPVMLMGTAAPHYSGNTFSGNAHPAIGLGGVFVRNGVIGTLELVPGAPDILTDNLPYVVTGRDDFGVDTNTWYLGPTYCTDGGGGQMDCPFVSTLHIPATAVFKFKADRKLLVDAFGVLDLQSTSDVNRVVFTAYTDDVVDDTNNDGNATPPAREFWHSITFRATDFQAAPGAFGVKLFDYALVKYSSYGVRVNYSGPITENFFPEIAHNRLEENKFGAYLYTMSGGDINSKVHDNLFISNQHGLGTAIDTVVNGVGISRPYVYSNTFQLHSGFPMYLGGTGYPVYDDDVPGGAGVNNNLFVSNAHLGVALGGPFNNDGQLALVYNGSTRLPFVVIADWRLSASTTASLPPSTVVKLDTANCENGGCAIFVSGQLDAQGTGANPVIFTSYKDDSAGGDTNGDGAASAPHKGDWWGVFLESNGETVGGSYVFDYAVVKYAERGLALRNFNNSDLKTAIANCIFTENTAGVFVKAFSGYNITSPVYNNVFQNNTTAISLTRESGNTGLALMTLTDNDLYGDKTSGNGLGMVATTGFYITATSNYWGQASGPYHATLNPSGTGVSINYPAGNTVLISPYDSGANQGGLTYSVLGRVSEAGDSALNPLPIQNAQVVLSIGGVYATTNATGNYVFSGLPLGATYTVQPLHSSFAFSPVTRTVTLLGDATEQNFTGTPVTAQTYAISGTVRDLNNQPLSNVLVFTVQSSSGIYNGDFTKADGTYAFNVPNGAYTLVAVYPNKTFAPATRPVTVNNGAMAGQDFNEFSGHYLYLPMIQR